MRTSMHIVPVLLTNVSFHNHFPLITFIIWNNEEKKVERLNVQSKHRTK